MQNCIGFKHKPQYLMENLWIKWPGNRPNHQEKDFTSKTQKHIDSSKQRNLKLSCDSGAQNNYFIQGDFSERNDLLARLLSEMA